MGFKFTKTVLKSADTYYYYYLIIVVF